MIHRRHYLTAMFISFGFVFLNALTINIACAEQATSASQISGKITNIIDASGYTYAEVDTGKNKVWAAAPVAPIKIGETISFSTIMPMKNFHSKTMDRDFDIVYFTDRFITDNKPPVIASVTPTTAHNTVKQIPKLAAEITKAKDGNTIAEIYSKKNTLKGKTIRVRGQVSKFTANIMNKNWLHIRDNSTADDLTITTDSQVAVNDIVVIEGKLELDKDYGYGYVYALIVEDAKISKD